MKNKVKLEKYVEDLENQFRKKFPKSKEIFDKGSDYFPNLVAQPARTFKPFPLFIKNASGSSVVTVDGVELLDFWQGHFCNILGHNHPVLTSAVSSNISNNCLLQSGFLTPLENELAELLRQTTDMGSFIFTTSGTLSTMYATMLGLSYSNKSLVLKLEGGWHGAQPWSLVGVKYPEGVDKNILESSGLPEDWDEKVMTVPMNNIESLREVFNKHGDKIGVFIIELVLGNSGMVMANKNFIKEARKLTKEHGTVLIIDEMVTGFRVCAGGLYRFYDIEPDLVTFGKAVTGGMPFACIAGKKEIIGEASSLKKLRVWADSGTFNCHPTSLKTAITVIKYLVKHEQEIYPSIIKKMDTLRNSCKEIMRRHNIEVDVTGESGDESIPNFPIGTIRFIKDGEKYDKKKVINHWNNDAIDNNLRDKVIRMSLMLKGIYVWQGMGVVTHAHSDEDIEKLISAYEEFATDLENI